MIYLTVGASKSLLAAIRKLEQKSRPGETILELFEKYASIRLAEETKRPDGVAQDRVVINLFARFVGVDRDVKSITIEDARNFRDFVRTLPVSFAKNSQYKDVPLSEIPALGKSLGAKTLSQTTLGRYISTVSPFFAWLRSEGYIDAQPFTGITPKVKKGSNRRPSFSRKHLNTIIHSPLFIGFERDGVEHRIGDNKTRDWRFWIPLLCLFTGARIGEIAQLRIQDVVKLHGVWCVHIREDAASGLKTKTRRNRTIPLHSLLQKIGFISYWKDLRHTSADGSRQLFPELTYRSKREQLGETPSRFWRDYLSNIGVKTGSDGIGAHSFRHTVTDELRLAGYLDSDIGPLILGHSSHTVTAGYGQLNQGTIGHRASMIEALQFRPQEINGVMEPGVDFGHLFVTQIDE